MASRKIELEYLDSRPIFIPRLAYYRDGVNIAEKGAVIKVTEREKRSLLKQLNGTFVCWEELKKEIKDEIIIEEVV